jgi:NADP-dependent 3-hydroxy acid dehydrogenase YdfG
VTAAGPLAGRTALVTGASRGIGQAAAARLAAAGARVALLARSAEALARVAASLGPGAVPVVCDVTRTGAVEEASARVADAFGAVPDVLVNNAGLFHLQPLEETTPSDFARTLETNLVAPFRFAHAFLGAMRDRGSGHVVTIGSIADRTTFPENGAYAASKYGLRAMHEVMRAELRGSGVRATLVSPGPVDTPLWDPIDPESRPGFTPRAAMLSAAAVADAILYALTCPPSVNVDELRLTRA